MTRRALLIGAQTPDLTGVENDVAMMTAALKTRDFEVRPCTGSDATRDGIIGAYEQLIADTGAGDPALVYFSGHGGYASPAPGETPVVTHTNRQFIVPIDYFKSEDDDFRGITAIELSVLLGRLTTKTANAVVVLDCCHAAMMSRGNGEKRAPRGLGDLRIRSLADPQKVDLEAHVRRQVDAGLRLELASPRGNRDAVKLVACPAGQPAYELRRLDGAGSYGVLTAALVRALDATGSTRVSWSQLMSRVRELVQLEVPGQRPEIEGPSERRLFEVDADDKPGSLPVTLRPDGRVRIEAARLLGVQVGDEFAIMPPSADKVTDDECLATVRVDEVELTAASGLPVYATPGDTVPPDARAYRTVAMAPLLPARVPAALEAALARSTFVQIAEPGDVAPIEVVESSDGALTVCDRIGPLHAPRQPGPDTVGRMLNDLDRIARATALRRMREPSLWTFHPPVTLEWGLVNGGKPQALPLAGAMVNEGDLVYLKVRNDSKGELYVSLIDIGVSYAITLLTDLAAGGLKVAAGTEYVYGSNDWTDQLAGVELGWPDGVDRRSARPETVLALITSQPQDLSPLVQHGVRGSDRESTPLTSLLAHFGAGATREFRNPALFCAPAFEFILDPVARANRP